jgi:hypothetical protein
MLRKALLIGALALVAPAAHAGGWQEAHETSDDVRIEVGPDGAANVVHHLRYRIVAGHFKELTLAGVDPHAELVPAAVIVPEKNGKETAARVEMSPKTPGAVRILIDEGKGLTRGSYTVDVKYRLDFAGQKMLARDGAMWKLSWTAPPASEGHDGARVTFDLPAAPTEPRLAGEATTTLATLRRGAERDELELVRPHVSRGDAVVWQARIDPKAFPQVSSPELRPPPPVETAPPSLLASHLARVLVAVGFAALAGALAILLRSKRAGVRAMAEEAGMQARPLLALPWGLGPFGYGVVTAAALATLLWSYPLVGAGLVIFAMGIAAHRSPAPIVKPRRPGSWEAVPILADRATRPAGKLDIGGWSGRIVFGLVLIAIAVASWLLRAKVPQIALALPLASVALVPIFVTGTRAQMPPAAVDLAVRMLRPARDALASSLDLAHVELATIGRVTSALHGGTSAPIDEVRLAGAPKDRTPGLRAIELALAMAPGGWSASPEVLVRFDAASAAARRIDRIAAGQRILRGRTKDENVVRLLPDDPTPDAAAALVARLLMSLEDRRARAGSAPAFRGRDRRVAAAALC